MKPKLNLIKEESSQESNGSKGGKGLERKELEVSKKKAETLKKKGTCSSFSSHVISTPSDSPKKTLLSEKKETSAAPTTTVKFGFKPLGGEEKKSAFAFPASNTSAEQKQEPKKIEFKPVTVESKKKENESKPVMEPNPLLPSSNQGSQASSAPANPFLINRSQAPNP